MNLEEAHHISSQKISTHNDRTLRKSKPTYMAGSSSFNELKTSNPVNFHSPLSVANIDDTRKFPCTELASSFMNLSVFYSHFPFSAIPWTR